MSFSQSTLCCVFIPPSELFLTIYYKHLSKQIIPHFSLSLSASSTSALMNQPYPTSLVPKLSSLPYIRNPFQHLALISLEIQPDLKCELQTLQFLTLLQLSCYNCLFNSPFLGIFSFFVQLDNTISHNNYSLAYTLNSFTPFHIQKLLVEFYYTIQLPVIEQLNIYMGKKNIN